MIKALVGLSLTFFGIPTVFGLIEGSYLVGIICLLVVGLGFYLMRTDNDMPTKKDFLNELRKDNPDFEINYKKRKK